MNDDEFFALGQKINRERHVVRKGRCRLPSGPILTDAAEYDCGCIIGHDLRIFVIRPCRITCDLYTYTTAALARLQKPMGMLFEPGRAHYEALIKKLDRIARGGP